MSLGIVAFVIVFVVYVATFALDVYDHNLVRTYATHLRNAFGHQSWGR
jgi:hypothetical protein